MRNPSRSLKRILRTILRRFGFNAYAPRLDESRDIEKRRYREIQRYNVTLNGIDVQFSTEDDYSNAWFFPRYADGRVHEKKVTDMLLDELKRAECFVDVGTNLGWYTCLAAKHMPGGVVYGFEMDDLNFSLLEKNLLINNCANVRTYNVAVSDSVGVVRYRRGGNNPSPAFRIETNEKPEKFEELVPVECIVLDDFLESEGVAPNVMKVDVEGAEMNVLLGMKRILKKYKPILFLEIHPYNLGNFGTTPSAILTMLAENNYNVFEITEMRNQDASKGLKVLENSAVLHNNAMLYATTGSR